MKIIGVRWHKYVLPFSNQYVTGDGSSDRRRGLLVSVRFDNGLTGIGEASPVGVGSYEAIERISTELSKVAPRLLSLNFDQALEIPLSPILQFGVETALLDAEGKQQGKPLVELLGGIESSVPANALIASDSPDIAADEARTFILQGFTSLKLKVGSGNLRQDEALVSAVREVIGANVSLRIDPNQSWSLPQAVEAVNTLAKYGLEYVEQPVANTDPLAMVELRRNTDTPIAADESVDSLGAALNIIANGAADIIIIKAARLGGLRNSLEVIHASQQAGIPAVVTSSLESGIGLTAGVHLAANANQHDFAHGLATGLLFPEDLLMEPMLPTKGFIDVPGNSGLGIQVDGNQLKAYETGTIGSVGDWR